jgi:hypothetical protein
MKMSLKHTNEEKKRKEKHKNCMKIECHTEKKNMKRRGKQINN